MNTGIKKILKKLAIKTKLDCLPFLFCTLLTCLKKIPSIGLRVLICHHYVINANVQKYNRFGFFLWLWRLMHTTVFLLILKSQRKYNIGSGLQLIEATGTLKNNWSFPSTEAKKCLTKDFHLQWVFERIFKLFWQTWIDCTDGE